MSEAPSPSAPQARAPRDRASRTRTDPITPPLADAIATALATHATQAFGLMGNGNAHLIDALGRAGIALTSVRHEAGTVAAADAYTRVSGTLAIATTTYGAGFTNALTALAEAAQARTPMLVVVGDAPTTGPRPWDIDQEMLAAAMGVRTVTVSADRPAEVVHRAADAAQRLRRPVVIAIPYDLAAAHVTPLEPEHGIDLADPALMRELTDAVLAPRPPETPEPASPEPAPSTSAPLSPVLTPRAAEITEVAQLLIEARRPLVIAGRGAHLSGAAAELGVIAERLGALTATTALARGIFPDPAFDLGVVGGFGHQPAMQVVAEADVVIVVGAALNPFTMRFGALLGAGTTIVRIDVDEVPAPPSTGDLHHVLLRGDAARVLCVLRTEIDALLPAPRGEHGWRDRVSNAAQGGAPVHATGWPNERDDGLCDDGRIDPRALARRLAELLPEDRHVTTDGGHFLGWCNMFWPVASPERMIMVGTAYQTIGLGLSTVAGIAAAAPDSTVVLSTGDGGGLMALADLETAIRTAARCVIVVWNDGGYSAEVHMYGAMGLDEQPMRIPEVDFARLAEALGATGVRVERLADLEALTRWRGAGGAGTILLDCRISPSVIAPYFLEMRRANGLADPGDDDRR